MKFINYIKDNLSQIIALVEKSLKFKFRWKFNLIISYVTPLITIILPLIIMEQFFNFNDNFGPWTKDNFLVYQFIAYNISLLRICISSFSAEFRREKYWETLPALIIAPFNRFNLLLGIFFSNLISISIPLAFFFIVCYIYYPISIMAFLLVIFLFFLLALFFSGIGLIMGIFTISNEKYTGILNFVVNLTFWFACLSYPFEVFPGRYQNLIRLNPFYYMFDIIRVAWIEDNVITSLSLHTFSFYLLLISAITLPCAGVIIFNKIYRKYGIVGY